VHIIVPAPAGGGADILMRAMAPELSQRWGKPVIVENKSGAGTIIGAAAVATATPDGHTLLATINPTVTSNRFMYKSLPYDPDKSFAPVSMMIKGDQFLVATSSVPAGDLRELIALAKRDPGKLSYGSNAYGSTPHLIFETLNRREKIDLLHVPYKGIAPVLSALAAKEVQLSVASAFVAGPMIKDGRIKPLAVAANSRSSQFPNVPTAAEQGYPYVQASIWYSLFAPAATPAAIIAKINADVVAVLRDPSFAQKHVTSKGLDVIAGKPHELTDAIKAEVVLTEEMVKAAGVKPE
jgi:tripartite-type tricarboxylate transporter receptor subunit TctC